MQDFKKDMKKNISCSRISGCPGGNLLRLSTCPQQIQPVGGKWAILLISNTVMETLCSLCLFFEGIFGPVHFTNAQIIQMYPED